VLRSHSRVSEIFSLLKYGQLARRVYKGFIRLSVVTSGILKTASSGPVKYTFYSTSGYPKIVKRTRPNVKSWDALYIRLSCYRRRSFLPMFRTYNATTILARRSCRPTRILSRSVMAPPKPNTSPPKKAAVIHNVAKLASESDKFRRVIWTGRHSQLVIMTVPAGGEIGEETHSVDQHLYFVSGTAQAITDGKHKDNIGPGDHVIIPAGTVHNVSSWKI